MFSNNIVLFRYLSIQTLPPGWCFLLITVVRNLPANCKVKLLHPKFKLSVQKHLLACKAKHTTALHLSTQISFDGSLLLYESLHWNNDYFRLYSCETNTFVNHFSNFTLIFSLYLFLYDDDNQKGFLKKRKAHQIFKLTKTPFLHNKHFICNKTKCTSVVKSAWYK